MNNPNPFVPKGSLLAEQSKRRSHLKLAVLCAVAIGGIGLMGMLIQGCKREQVSEENQNPPPADTNTVAVDTNPPPMVASNPPVAPPPVVVQPPPAPAGTEYVVVHGDTLGKIAKRNGVTLSALKAANPGVEPTKLKVGQKLTIPAGGTTPAAAGASAGSDTGMGGETYTVKSGDSLTKIAKAHGTTVKALRAENNLTTDHIKVGQKLKIPAKAEAAAPAPAPAPVEATPPPASAPAPAGTPAGQ
ncbi:MAG: LysM peptidoglycan-binding domain-containing protein [Verrucomicrobiota bacterium]